MTPIGTQQMSYTMTPNGLDGRAINGGMAYANADTIERAREWANKVVARGECAGQQVGTVEIVGRMMRLGFEAWQEVRGADARWVREVVVRTAPVEYRGRDAQTRCYDTTILDRFETVHERRSDGSCRCGEYAATFGISR